MVLALIVFVRMWIITHKPKEPQPGKSPPSAPGMQVDVAPPSQAAKAPSPTLSPDCRALERALDAVVRSPDDAQALAEAQGRLEACPEPPARACELGTALDVRAPLTPAASPARELLRTLCQRCPAQVNSCAGFVGRAFMGGIPGRRLEPAEVRWNLENAGPGRASACSMMVRAALVPVAVTGGQVNPAHPPLLTALAPLCAQEGHLPTALVHAVVVQQGTKAGALNGLTTTRAATSSPIAPQQITGAEAGSHAFDGNEQSGVELSNGVTERWEADGALRARFQPPLKQLTQVRVRAKGPGSLRAIVRSPKGLGLEDKERGTFFVNPTLCHFKGSGRWETCSLPAPLVDVEALSVFPRQPKISLYELEASGTR
ncbi:MAG: hypothetical protein JXB05_26485 [Myxococcaceae bacterium]|nr:hypothetical protein [Myxococcaceae bacterium]